MTTIHSVTFDSFSCIYIYLSPKDLLQLALTCRSMRDMAYMFCSRCQEQNETMLREFFENTYCLTSR